MQISGSVSVRPMRTLIVSLLALLGLGPSPGTSFVYSTDPHAFAGRIKIAEGVAIDSTGARDEKFKQIWPNGILITVLGGPPAIILTAGMCYPELPDNKNLFSPFTFSPDGRHLALDFWDWRFGERIYIVDDARPPPVRLGNS